MVVYYLGQGDHLYTIRDYLGVVRPGEPCAVIPLSYARALRTMTRRYWARMAREAYRGVAARGRAPLARERRQAALTLMARLGRYVRARPRWPRAVYIFSDIERLLPDTAEQAAVLCTMVAPPGSGSRVLNHPIRSMRRYELLRTLYERGVNAFDVYRLTEARWPARYPVFVRRENGHEGPLSPLLRNREELEQALARLDAQNVSRETLLVSEFCDTSDERGVFRKYGAFVIGERVFVRSVQFSRHWVQKRRDLQEPELLREEREYIEENPHREAIRRIFELARIEYGRMDYGIRDGRIQVWEINTNPLLASSPESRKDPRRGWINERAHRQITEAMELLGRSGAAPLGEGPKTPVSSVAGPR